MTVTGLRLARVFAALTMGVLAAGVAAGQSAAVSAGAGPWIPMFDGASLKGWKVTPFDGRGQVDVKDGTIRLGSGRTTGITWTGEFPKYGYEIRFEAARLEGQDFFASIVFPVRDSYCSWISGGWDGTVVGLSNLEGNDASENDTSTTHEFEQGRWYAFRLIVTESRIQGWIDGTVTIDIEYTGRKVELRFDDMDLCKPLGFASYRTVGGLRNMAWRRLASNK